jgi:sulfur-oxidizing protein SoxY
MNKLRRTFLKGAGSVGVISVAVAAGLLKPAEVLASDWNGAGFTAKDADSALKGINAVGAAQSADITLKAPDIAENGAVVPLEVTSKLPNTDYIALVVDTNVNPLCCTFALSNGTEGYVSTRVKMAKTSQVRALCRSGGKMFYAAKEVKVTIGGCGG